MKNVNIHINDYKQLLIKRFLLLQNDILPILYFEYDLIIYVSPEGVDIEDNGVRTIDAEYRDKIDFTIMFEIILFLLIINNYDYYFNYIFLTEKKINLNELDKAAQFHDMTYAIFKDTKDRHVFDKKLQDEAFNIVKDGKHSLKDRAEAGLVGRDYLKRLRKNA